MGKGSQAKIYFVLYLAIVVELLIIIVERDEAEEHLHRQNNETMKIVESILSQLYSGSGTEGINTKPQDEITLPAEADMAAVKEIFGSELKTWRQYQIDVGVTDVALAIKRKEGETSKEYEERIADMLSLANVEDLEYQVFFTPSQSADTVPAFQSDDYISENQINFMDFQGGQNFPGPHGEPWTFIGAYKLSFDKDASYARLDPEKLMSTLDFAPLYKPLIRIGTNTSPRGMDDSVFFYSDTKTSESAKENKSAQKRSFVVNFEPPDRGKAGIYKLRFASKTNRILGVATIEGKRQASDEETKVNIGTVQLTVKDLKKVASELKRSQPDLDKIISIDELSVATGDDFVKKMNNFNTEIEAAKVKAMESSNSADLIGKIRLYEYVARLVVPGQSINFDQNRSNFDINVRVQTAKPSTAKPYISMLTDNRSFTNAKHAFEIEAGPYKGTNRVTGRIVGPTTADISFTQEGTPERDKKYRLRGQVNRELPAGKYVMEITHEITGKSEISRDTLWVYDAGIQEEERTDRRIRGRLVYGRALAADILPNSGNDIPASQFKTIVTFDGGNRKEIQGYTVLREAEAICKAEYSKCAVTLVWVQPITFQQYTLFAIESDIKLEDPSVYGDNLVVKYSGSGNKITVEAAGLMVLAPLTGLDDKSKRITLSEPQLKDAGGEINGYTVTSQPRIVGGDADNGYIVEFELTKNPSSNVKTAEGAVTIPVSLTAKHPTNGKTSRIDNEFMVAVSYTPSVSRAPGARGGNARPNPKAPARPPARKK